MTTPALTLEEHIRVALTDDDAWDILTETPESKARVREWLRTTRLTVNADLGRRRREWAAKAATLRQGSPAFKAELDQYSKWRSKATAFMTLLDRRLLELNSEAAQQNHAHVHVERKQMRAMVLDLARLVRDHEAGALDDVDLHRALDDMTLEHGTSEFSLRAVLTLTGGDV